MTMVPVYPTWDVVWPCVCGSWPGGECLKCRVIGSEQSETKGTMNRQRGIIADIYIYAVVACVAFALGAGVAVKVQQPKIDKLHEQVGAYQTSVAALTASTAKQNKAIDDMTMAANQRAEVARAAVGAAKQAGVSRNQKAQSILMQKPVPGKDVCDEASAAFSEELRSERAK